MFSIPYGVHRYKPDFSSSLIERRYDIAVVAPQCLKVPNSAVDRGSWALPACSILYGLDYIFILSPALGLRRPWRGLSMIGDGVLSEHDSASDLSFQISRYGANPPNFCFAKLRRAASHGIPKRSKTSRAARKDRLWFTVISRTLPTLLWD